VLSSPLAFKGSNIYDPQRQHVIFTALRANPVNSFVISFYFITLTWPQSSPCNNGTIALVLELLADQNVQLQQISTGVHSRPSVSQPETSEPTAGPSYRRRNAKANVNRSLPRVHDQRHLPRQLLDLKVSWTPFVAPVIPSSLLRYQDSVRRFMHELMLYPASALISASAQNVKRYNRRDPDAVGPALDPLVLDLTSKGASLWNSIAATYFLEKFLSLGLSTTASKEEIERIFSSHIEQLRAIYAKQNFDVDQRLEAQYAAVKKARYSRRRQVCPHFVHLVVYIYRRLSCETDDARRH